jgi:3-methylfumaryl-CoA hydratase
MSATDDLEACLAGWDPPPVTADDAMDPMPGTALAAALDRPPPSGGVLPPLWHWLHFLHWPRTDALGADGHPADGDFLPPIPDRTRMFAGGRLQVLAALRTGAPARRRATVVGRTVKEGRSGPMLFVTVRHEIEQGGKVALVDEQDLMYRSGPAPARPAAPPPASQSPEHQPPEYQSPQHQPARDEWPWREAFVAGPVLLFRFSALTANSHRIHYDHPYVTAVEGYPGLVVHGPLLAVLMAGLVGGHEPQREVASIRYRFLRPVFAGDEAAVVGRPVVDGAEAAVLGADGAVSARSEVSWAADR